MWVWLSLLLKKKDERRMESKRQKQHSPSVAGNECSGKECFASGDQRMHRIRMHTVQYTTVVEK